MKKLALASVHSGFGDGMVLVSNVELWEVDDGKMLSGLLGEESCGEGWRSRW